MTSADDDDEKINERVRLYAHALHQRAVERVLHQAKQQGIDWVGPLWVEAHYAEAIESLRREGAA